MNAILNFKTEKSESDVVPNPPVAFNFNGHEVRTIHFEDEVWFVCADVAKALGYRNAPDASRHLDNDEKGTHTVRTLGGNQSVVVITESGLYALVLRSRKPEARKFAKWVTNEVLPSIRKNGAYIAVSSQIESAYKLAAHVASVAASTVFQAVLSGENRHDRWMFHMNWDKEDPAPWAAPIGHDEMVVSLAELPHRLLESNGTYASNAELLAIASACHHRLTQRLGRPQ